MPLVSALASGVPDRAFATALAHAHRRFDLAAYQRERERAAARGHLGTVVGGGGDAYVKTVVFRPLPASAWRG